VSTIPNRLQVGTTYEEAMPLINENFDKVVQDIRDLGANTSTDLVITKTVPATSLDSFVVTLTSKGVASSSVYQVITQKPVAGISGLSPAVDIYIDTNNDLTKLFPYGSGLTSASRSLFPIVTTLNTGFVDSVGAVLIQLNNRDSVTHTYYVHISCDYFPSPAQGIFR
jgi:hypothetical protein